MSQNFHKLRVFHRPNASLGKHYSIWSATLPSMALPWVALPRVALQCMLPTSFHPGSQAGSQAGSQCRLSGRLLSRQSGRVSSSCSRLLLMSGYSFSKLYQQQMLVEVTWPPDVNSARVPCADVYQLTLAHYILDVVQWPVGSLL